MELLEKRAAKGLYKFGQMFGDKGMKSFEQMSSHYSLTNSHLLTFFKVKKLHFFNIPKKRSIQDANLMLKCTLKM